VGDPVLTNIGAGEIIYDLREKIQKIKSELNQLGVISDIPELITSANLLRSNEYLLKVNDKKTTLISVYETYSKSLEELLLSVFDIQKDLKEILKEQSHLISTQSQKKSRPKSKTRKK